MTFDASIAIVKPRHRVRDGRRMDMRRSCWFGRLLSRIWERAGDEKLAAAYARPWLRATAGPPAGSLVIQKQDTLR